MFLNPLGKRSLIPELQTHVRIFADEIQPGTYGENHIIELGRDLKRRDIPGRIFKKGPGL